MSLIFSSTFLKYGQNYLKQFPGYHGCVQQSSITTLNQLLNFPHLRLEYHLSMIQSPVPCAPLFCCFFDFLVKKNSLFLWLGKTEVWAEAQFGKRADTELWDSQYYLVRAPSLRNSLAGCVCVSLGNNFYATSHDVAQHSQTTSDSTMAQPYSTKVILVCAELHHFQIELSKGSLAVKLSL